MGDERTHYVTTSDGVTIGGTVHGQGPPIVFVQGIVGDGDMDWAHVVPHLTGRFTCYLPSVRGRGLSGDHPDLSLGRLIDDFLTYVDSIGEPTRVVGWSGGGSWALGMAAQSDMVAALASIEPVASSVMAEQDQMALRNAVARTGELAAEGNLTAAARAFAGFPFTDEDIGAAEDAGYFEAAGRYVPNLVNFFKQMMNYEGTKHYDPAILGAISVPVLLLLGSETKSYATTSARHVAAHVPNAKVREIPGAGHAAPLTHPQTLAEALTDFFASVQQSA